MVDHQFEKIAATGSPDCDYTSMVTWHAAIQGESNTVHIGVLASSDEIEQHFDEFVKKKEYDYTWCDFLLITEAGEILASYIGQQWEVHTPDVHQAFRRPLEDPERYRSVAREYIQRQFDELDKEFDRSEVQVIIQTLSQKFAEMVARNPLVLNELEWRDMERMLAEVFRGIGFGVRLTPPSKDGGKDVILTCIVSGNEHSYIVEIKHWRSATKVGSTAIKTFFDIVVREKRNAGVFLSTYGYTSSAIRVLTEVERHKITLGEKEKIVSLCKTYLDAGQGLVVPPELLPRVLLDETI